MPEPGQAAASAALEAAFEDALKAERRKTIRRLTALRLYGSLLSRRGSRS